MGFLFLILNLFISSITGFTWFFDWVSRIDINDSFINLFNFFWTTFLYLPSFFFLILLINVLSTNFKSIRSLSIYLVTLYILYNIEIFDFLILNLNFEISNLNITGVNLLLTNNLNKYHPLIFYTSVVLLLNLLYQNYSIWFNSLLFTKTYISNYTYFNINSVTVINLLALFLGSWWALQEGTWGGWWNWDPSEVLGLLFAFTGLLYLHSRITYLTTQLSLYRLVYIVILIIFSYIFIQLNFDLVSHNFGSKFFFFFNNNLFFLELTLWLVVNFWVFLYFIQNAILNTVLINITNFTDHFIKKNNLIVWTLVLYLLLFTLIIFSFIPLVNYFLWVYFHINSLNFIIKSNIIIICLILGSVLPFISILRTHLLLIYLLVLLNLPSLISVFTLSLIISFKFSKWLHSLLIILFVSNILSYNTQFIYWYTFTELVDLIFDSELLEKRVEIYSCNNHFIDYINLSQTSTQTLFNTWNVFYLNNTTSLNNFNLLFNGSSFVNLYYLFVNWQHSVLFIETNYLNNMLEEVLFLLLIITIGVRNLDIDFYRTNY